MTLYTFSRDDAGKSNCYAKCAEYWPPLTAEAGAEPVGEFLIFARDDGTSQWAHRGQPLYLFALDKQPGDTMGELSGDVAVATFKRK
jgi:predicted lipoprotein with Yx(FWY)xxD motif